MSEPSIFVNGRPDGTVAAFDRGLSYGDGLFETIAVRDGRPMLWARHWQRLATGCERLKLPVPASETVAAEVARLAAGRTRAVVKVVVTRGSGGRGYRLPAVPAPTRIVSVHPWPDYPSEYRRDGVAVRWCKTPLGHSPALAGLKHLNRLEQVLARAEWDDPAIAEGLMCGPDGSVMEGTMSNLFLVAEGRLLTPSLARGGVCGVMRGAVLDCARELGLVCEARFVDVDAVRAADELFLTNSVIGVWPIRSLDGRRWPVGAVTRRLAQAVVRMEETT